MKIMDVIKKDYALVFDCTPTEIHIHFLHGGTLVVKKHSLLPQRRARYARFRAVLDLAGEGSPWISRRMWMGRDEFELLWRGS